MRERYLKKLQEKLENEYGKYMEKMNLLPSKEIINNAYAITVKQELIDMFNDKDSFSLGEIKALLSLESPLEYLYNEWLQVDGGLYEKIYDDIEYNLVDLALEYRDDLLSKIGEKSDLYYKISEICSYFDLYNRVCDDLKSKFEVKDLDVVDINEILSTKDGKSYMYNFLSDLKNNDRVKELSEKNINIYQNLEIIEEKILPELNELIKREERNKREQER